MAARCGGCHGKKIATYEELCRRCGGTGSDATRMLEGDGADGDVVDVNDVERRQLAMDFVTETQAS
jgi:hypothetical protein